jgi:hypothetical protein
MKRFFTIYFVLLIGCFKGQIWKWAYSYGTPTQMDYGTIVNTDKYGNIYVTGVMERVFTGGPNDYSYATFWKFDKNGQLLWQDTISGAIAAKTDAEGNTYMIAGNNLLKYNSNGSILWQKTLDMQFGTNIAFHPDGGLVVSGTTADRGRIARYDENGNKFWQIGGQDMFGSGKAGNTLICSNDGNIVYMEGCDYAALQMYCDVFDKNGNFVRWFKIPDYAQNITIDSQSNIYFSYKTQFISKYSITGDSLWTKLYHGGQWPGITGLAVDSIDNLIVSGWYNVDLMINHVMIVNTGQQESFVMKYSKNGDILWLTHSSMDTIRKADMTLVSMNHRGNEIVLAGQVNGGESFGSYTISTPVSEYVDLLVVKLADEPAVGIKTNVIQNSNFFVFPNPSSGHFNINLSAAQAKNSKLSVVSASGAKVLEQTINDNNTKRILDLSNLKKGSYLIHLSSVEGTETRKVIIE